MNTKKTIFVVILLIFFMGVATYINEINTTSVKITNADNLIRNSIDISIDQCLASDDFYVDGFNYGYGVSEDNKDNVTSTTLWVSGTSDEKNLLDAVMVADNSGYLNMRSARTSSALRSNAISGGNIFKVNAFKWQFNTSSNNDFRAFYNWIRNTGLFTSTVYNLENGSYVPREVCTLDLMGTGELFSTTIRSTDNIHIINSEDVTSIMKDGAYGSYMLTPTALGITYINQDMLETVIKSNIEMSCAYHYMNVDSNIRTDSKYDIKHIGCLGASSMYYGLSHTDSPSEYIVNNGVIEVDLNSVNVQVEYRAIDMFDSSNNDILNEALGAKPLGIDASEGYVYTGDRAGYLRQLYNLGDSSKYIVVAKVDVDMTIHIQYSSPLLQLYRSMQSSSVNHLDIQSINQSTGQLDASANGLVYKYTKYVAVTP